MYYRKFIEFLKKHNLYNEEIVEYFNSNSTRFDYLDDEYREYIGIYYLKNKYNDLCGMIFVVPYMTDDKTVLINIHEYVHLLLEYKKLDKYFNLKKDAEVLPIFYEKVFVEENKTDELINYHEELNNSIYEAGKEEYVLALNVSNELINNYNNESIKELDHKVKRLVLKKEVNKVFNNVVNRLFNCE